MADYILITGGSSGIGASVARLASQRGIPVAITFRSHPGEAAALVAELKAGGGEAHAFSADVAREADVVRAFEQADAAFPGRSLAGLVNSAAQDRTPGRDKFASAYGRHGRRFSRRQA